MPFFNVRCTDKMHDAIKDLCAANGYKLTFALRRGLMMFFLASHEERIAVEKEFERKLKFKLTE